MATQSDAAVMSPASSLVTDEFKIGVRMIWHHEKLFRVYWCPDLVWTSGEEFKEDFVGQYGPYDVVLQKGRSCPGAIVNDLQDVVFSDVEFPGRELKLSVFPSYDKNWHAIDPTVPGEPGSSWPDNTGRLCKAVDFGMADPGVLPVLLWCSHILHLGRSRIEQLGLNHGLLFMDDFRLSLRNCTLLQWDKLEAKDVLPVVGRLQSSTSQDTFSLGSYHDIFSQLFLGSPTLSWTELVVLQSCDGVCYPHPNQGSGTKTGLHVGDISELSGISKKVKAHFAFEKMDKLHIDDDWTCPAGAQCGDIEREVLIVADRLPPVLTIQIEWQVGCKDSGFNREELNPLMNLDFVYLKAGANAMDEAKYELFGYIQEVREGIKSKDLGNRLEAAFETDSDSGEYMHVLRHDPNRVESIRVRSRGNKTKVERPIGHHSTFRNFGDTGFGAGKIITLFYRVKYHQNPSVSSLDLRTGHEGSVVSGKEALVKCNASLREMAQIIEDAAEREANEA